MAELFIWAYSVMLYVIKREFLVYMLYIAMISVSLSCVNFEKCNCITHTHTE